MKFRTAETYEIITWIDDEDPNGYEEERGFIFQDQYYTFRELVQLMRGAGYCYASSSVIDARTWFITDKYNEDYSTGAIENRSIHIEMSARNKKRLVHAVGIK